MIIRVSALSIFEVGQRSNQEDCIFPAFSESPQTGDLFILCDGMGGHEKGEVASQTVCQVMSSFIEQHRREDGGFDESDFNEALSAAYDALDAKDTAVEKKMGTTLTFVKFHNEGCFVAHIGDSRIYHIRPATKAVLHKTRDHSLVNDLVSLGELTPEQARLSQQKNIITRAMQPHQERRAQADCTNLSDIQAGDYIYMCSDGMLEISEDSEIVNVLSMDRTDADKIEILKGATRENRDNHSAHLIRIVSVDTTPEKVVVPPVTDSPITPLPSAQRSAMRRSIFPIILGLVFLGLVSYGMVTMLKKTRPPREDPMMEDTRTEGRPDDSKPPRHRQNNRHSAQTTPTQTPISSQNQDSSPVMEPVQDNPVADHNGIPDNNLSILPDKGDEADIEAEYGRLVVNTYPAGALVFLDGADTGKRTPATFDDLSVTSHSIEFRLEGYETQKQIVDIAKQKIINLTLKSIENGQ